MEEFRSSVSVQQFFAIRQKRVGPKPNVLFVGRATITKDALTERNAGKCANCKGPHVASYKGCPAYKKQAFRQHVVDNQKSYSAILRQNTAPPQPQDKTFTFLAKQLVKFVANVAI